MNALTLNRLFLLLPLTGRANYDFVDSGWDSRDDRKGVKAGGFVLDTGGVNKVGVGVIL